MMSETSGLSWAEVGDGSDDNNYDLEIKRTEISEYLDDDMQVDYSTRVNTGSWSANGSQDSDPGLSSQSGRPQVLEGHGQSGSVGSTDGNKYPRPLSPIIVIKNQWSNKSIDVSETIKKVKSDSYQYRKNSKDSFVGPEPEDLDKIEVVNDSQESSYSHVPGTDSSMIRDLNNNLSNEENNKISSAKKRKIGKSPQKNGIIYS